MDLLAVIAIAIIANFLIKTLLLRDLTVDQAHEMIQKGAVIVDVRTENEYSTANIKESVHVPLNELKEKIETVVPDKEKTVLLHCRSGSRSFAAKRMLKRLGYTNAYNIGSFGRAKKIAGNS
jgi:rhodanese-related sulfurtransferase